MTLGAILRHHRQLQGLSQPDLASRAQIEQSYLSKLENDHSIPSEEILQRLLHSLNMDIGELCAQLDTQKSDPRVLHIECIRNGLNATARKNQLLTTLMTSVLILAISVGVALFYVGHSKAFFPETLYSYESRGELAADEPADYFHGGWRRAQPSGTGFPDNQLSEQVRGAEIAQANRISYHTIRSFRPLENNFSQQLENGNRREYRAVVGQQRVTRAQNGWLMFFGVVLAVSGMIALTLTRRSTSTKNS